MKLTNRMQLIDGLSRYALDVRRWPACATARRCCRNAWQWTSRTNDLRPGRNGGASQRRSRRNGPASSGQRYRLPHGRSDI